MTDKRVITGPFLDSLETAEATGVMVITGTSDGTDGSGAYVSTAPYVVQIANGQALLSDGVTPLSLPVTADGQAFEFLIRWQPSGAASGVRVPVPDEKSIRSVPAGGGPIPFVDLPIVSVVTPGNVFVDARAILDAYNDTLAAVAGAQDAQAGAEQAKQDIVAINPIPMAQKQIANGVAPINAFGQVLNAAGIPQISQTVAELISVPATPDRLAQMKRDLGVTDDSIVIDPNATATTGAVSTGLQFMIDHLPESAKGRIFIPNGTYRINAALAETGAELHIIGGGANFLQGGRNALMDAKGAWEPTIQLVGAPVKTSVVYNNLSATNTVDCSVITVPAGADISSWAEGDFVKVFSNDRNFGARPNKTAGLAVTATFPSSGNVITTNIPHGLVVGDTMFFPNITGYAALTGATPYMVKSVPSSTTLTLGNFDWLNYVITTEIALSGAGSASALAINTEGRLGEFAMIHSISGRVVTLKGLLYSQDRFGQKVDPAAPDSNVRVAKMLKITSSITGDWSWTAHPDAFNLDNPYTNGVISMQSLLVPIVEGGTIYSNSSYFAKFGSCFGYVADNCSIFRLADFPGKAMLGYVIQNSMSTLGYVSPSVISHSSRHAYTDDFLRLARDTDAPQSYGGACYDTIMSKSFGSSSSAFAPHQGGHDHMFIATVAQNCLASGYASRGTHHKYYSIRSIDNAQDFSLIEDDDGGETYGIEIDGLYANSPNRQKPAITASNNKTGPTPGVRDGRQTLTVRNAIIEGSGQALLATNVTILLDAVRAIMPASIPANTAGVLSTNSVVTGELDLDYTHNTDGTGLVALQATSASAGGQSRYEFINGKLRVRLNPEHISSGRFTYVVDGNSNLVAVVPDTIVDNWAIGKPFNTACSTGSRVSYTTPDRSISSKIVKLDIATAVSANMGQSSQSADPVRRFSITNTATATENRLLTSIPPGAFDGQETIIDYSFAAFPAATLGLQSSASFNVALKNGTTQTITHLGMFVLVWDAPSGRHLLKSKTS